MQLKMRRWWRGGFLLCMMFCLLTACSRQEQGGVRPDKSGTDNKTGGQPERTRAGGLLGNGYSDVTYQYGNSTNLYKDYSNSEEDGMRNSDREGNPFVQYDLSGNYVQDIMPAGGVNGLLSVDDVWIYYTAQRQKQIVVCRMPVKKQDGGDVIDTAKEEILLMPEQISEEEKKLGIREKDDIFGGCCYITPRYIIYIMGVYTDEEDKDVEEIIRYNPQTKEYTYQIFDAEDSELATADSGGYVSASGDIIVCFDEYGCLFFLNVDSLTVMSPVELGFMDEDAEFQMMPDGNSFYCLSQLDELMLYSLEEMGVRFVVSSSRLTQAVCLAENAEKTASHIAYHLLGSYSGKIYLRYLLEQEQNNICSAHYGVLSVSAADGEIVHEKEISEAVQGGSVPLHGQWIRYKKVGKQEKKAAKREGRKPKKTVDKQYELNVNLGNPQRVIGNQLFFRSINQNIENNAWFCYCLDTNRFEKLTEEDARNEWIYLQDSEGWELSETYLSATDDIECIDDYDDNDLVKVVWDALPSEQSTANAGQKSSVKEQLQYMAGHRYDWLRGMAGYAADGGGDEVMDDLEIGMSLNWLNYGDGLKYIVTDCNQNGRLEVITLDMIGSGGFTNICAYEYSFETQGMEPVDGAKWQTVPDIGDLKKTDVYYDKKQKEYRYFCKDFTHASGWDNWNELCLWGIDEKEGFCYESYGYQEFSYDEKAPVHYYIGKKKVTKKEFKKKKKNMEPKMKKGKATFCWQQDGQALTEMSEQELLEKLTKSWEGFSVKK